MFCPTFQDGESVLHVVSYCNSEDTVKFVIERAGDDADWNAKSVVRPSYLYQRGKGSVVLEICELRTVDGFPTLASRNRLGKS
jgi:hypothetical protein